MILILHLSDIHFKSGHNIITNRMEKLFETIKNETLGKEAIFIITTGDIAFSGKVEEYHIAYKFYSGLFNSIKNYSKQEANFLFIPGNHDCLFAQEIEEVRKLILDKFDKDGFGDLSEALIENCCGPLDNYFNFISKINSELSNKSIITEINLSHPLLSIHTYEINGKRIKFNLFNTAWVSRLPERIGNMGFPIEYISEKIPQIKNNVSISLIHHPLNWQTPENSKLLADYLNKTSEIIISGHEHVSRLAKKSDIENKYETITIESPALQESDNIQSGFNLLLFNIEDESLNINKFNYENEGPHKTYILQSESGPIKIEKERKLKSYDFQLKDIFRTQLNDVGTKYSHSQVENILLDDLFIAPYLQDLTVNYEGPKQRYSQFFRSNEVLNIEDSSVSNFYKIIVGGDSAGKTTILKYYFLDYYDKGYLPLYLKSNNFSLSDLEKTKKAIKKEFLQQYDELDAKFENLDFRKLVILLDDFHLITSSKIKVNLLKHLTSLFSKIILTGNDLLRFEAFKDKKGQTIDLYENFNWFLIKEFNPSLRNQLITKWYRLGRDYLDVMERNELYRKIDLAAENVDEIVGKNFVPAYPVYILAILQGLETGESSSSSNKQHAYYYEMLITNSLKRVLDDKEEIGFYMTLCKEYFYFLFKEKIRFNPIDQNAFTLFFDNHKRIYRISRLNDLDVLTVLFKSKILVKDRSENISIAYKYLYYYFVAKYMADNLEDHQIKTEVELMADRVYRDEYSNIIIFLIHLARNNYVIKKLIEKSKLIYSTFDPIHLENDIDFINKLQLVAPEQVLLQIDVDEARKRGLQNVDEYEENELSNTEENLCENYELDEDITQLNYLALITKAIRTIEILGQLSKKYWGELKGDDKFELSEETYLLGLRTLKQHFSLVDNVTEGLIKQVKTVLLKKYKLEELTATQIEVSAGNYLFNLLTASTFGILKRISNAIGTENLSDIFIEIAEKHPINSVYLTNLGIKLEHFNSFPTTDLDRLKESNKNNILGLSVIRKYLIDYMYMYDLEFSRRQQICEKFGIKMQDQRFISGSSPIKKM